VTVALRIGFVVFVSDDVRVKELDLPEAMLEVRLSEAGEAAEGSVAIDFRAESLRGS